MKKQFLLSILFLMFLGSCNSDDYLQFDEPYPSNNKELLLSKAVEFSAKYGVNIALNEDSLDKNPTCITVEELEKEFVDFSLFLKNSEFRQILNENEDVKQMHRSVYNSALDTMGMHNFSGEVYYRRNYYDGAKNYRLGIEGAWRHDFYQGYSYVIASFKLEEEGHLLGETGLMEVHSVFSSITGYLQFDARGNFTISSGLYTYSFGVNICYNQLSGYSYYVY